MAIINIKNLTFGYDGSYENVFENVDLNLDTSWRLGLTGRNGRGKTTLLRLLMGELEYSGSISAAVDFEYFPYKADGELLTLEVVQQAAPSAEDWEICRELSLLECDAELLYRPFGTLSNGEQTKALLAGMFLRENSFLLIDEPTNHLDLHAREVLAGYLRRKSGFILVSHDRAFLDRCIDHVLAINRCSIEVQSGNYSTWSENKQLQDNYERAENERLKRQIQQLETAARRAAAHSDKIAATKIGFDPVKTEKSAARRPSIAKKAEKLMSRSKAMEVRIERDIAEKGKLLKNVESANDLKLIHLPYHTSRLALLSHVTLSYGGREVCRDISFTIEQGDRIALCGANGSGKSSLIRLLMGEDISHSGEAVLGSRLTVSYVPQSADGLCGTLSHYAEQCGVDESVFKAMLNKLDFSKELFSRPIESYSQGQKKKVLIARSLSERAHLYIWDEPLNYIDVISRIQIEQLLTASGATMLFVEHDRVFCENVATKTVEL